MKSLLIKSGNMLLLWGTDVLHAAADYLYYLEHGKTPQQAALEFLRDIKVVSAHEAKEMWKSKKGAN